MLNKKDILYFSHVRKIFTDVNIVCVDKNDKEHIIEITDCDITEQDYEFKEVIISDFEILKPDIEELLGQKFSSNVRFWRRLDNVEFLLKERNRLMREVDALKNQN